MVCGHLEGSSEEEPVGVVSEAAPCNESAAKYGQSRLLLQAIPSKQQKGKAVAKETREALALTEQEVRSLTGDKLKGLMRAVCTIISGKNVACMKEKVLQYQKAVAVQKAHALMLKRTRQISEPDADDAQLNKRACRDPSNRPLKVARHDGVDTNACTPTSREPVGQDAGGGASFEVDQGAPATTAPHTGTVADYLRRSELRAKAKNYRTCEEDPNLSGTCRRLAKSDREDPTEPHNHMTTESRIPQKPIKPCRGKEAPSMAKSSEAERRARERRAEHVRINTRRWRAGKKAAGLREIRFHAEEGLVKQLERLGDLFGVFGGVEGSSERTDIGKVAALLIADLLSGDLAAYRKVLVIVGVCMKGQESLSAVGGLGTVNRAAATGTAHGTSVPFATPIPQPNRDYAWTPSSAAKTFAFQSQVGQRGARAKPAGIGHPDRLRKSSGERTRLSFSKTTPLEKGTENLKASATLSPGAELRDNEGTPVTAPRPPLFDVPAADLTPRASAPGADAPSAGGTPGIARLFPSPPPGAPTPPARVPRADAPRAGGTSGTGRLPPSHTPVAPIPHARVSGTDAPSSRGTPLGTSRLPPSLAPVPRKDAPIAGGTPAARLAPSPRHVALAPRASVPRADAPSGGCKSEAVGEPRPAAATVRMQHRAAAFQRAAAANPMLRNPFDFATEQLLSSEQLHNIALSLSDQPSWKPVAPFTNEHLLISLGNYVRGNSSWPSEILRRAEDGLGSPVILTTDGEHWRAVFIDGPAKTVFYWDPLYEAYFGPGDVPGAFRNAFSSQGWVHKQLKMRVQSDGFQCGVWVSVFQQIVVQYRGGGAEVRGLTFEAFFRRKLASEGVFLLPFDGVIDSDLRMRNEAFAAVKREEFRGRLGEERSKHYNQRGDAPAKGATEALPSEGGEDEDDVVILEIPPASRGGEGLKRKPVAGRPAGLSSGAAAPAFMEPPYGADFQPGLNEPGGMSGPSPSASEHNWDARIHQARLEGGPAGDGAAPRAHSARAPVCETRQEGSPAGDGAAPRAYSARAPGSAARQEGSPAAGDGAASHVQSVRAPGSAARQEGCLAGDGATSRAQTARAPAFAARQEGCLAGNGVTSRAQSARAPASAASDGRDEFPTEAEDDLLWEADPSIEDLSAKPPEVCYAQTSRVLELARWTALHGACGGGVETVSCGYRHQAQILACHCAGCGAKRKWYSSEIEDEKGAFQLSGRAVCAWFMAGLNYEQQRAHAAIMGLPVLPRRYFFTFQRERVQPAILAERDATLRRSRENAETEVLVETDAQFDTDRDGKWCTVEFLDNKTGEVLHVETVTQREAGGSSYAEALGTDKGLKFLKAELESLGKGIVEIVHDNNTNVDSKIAAIVPNAKNSKDMWHNTKAHAFKEKLESIIALYQELQTIDGELRELDTKHRGGLFQLFKNHFYWAAMRALEDGEDDAMMLAVRFVEGGLAHLIDDHSLCEDRHTSLRHSKLKKDGPAYKALLEWAREAATDSKAIFFTRCRKLARTESLHRVNNKYAGKLYFYRKSYPARVALAQLDYTGHRDIYASLFGVDSARAREAGTVGREEDLGLQLQKPKKVRSEKKHYNFRRAILNRVFNPRGTKSASYADEVCVGER